MHIWLIFAGLVIKLTPKRYSTTNEKTKFGMSNTQVGDLDTDHNHIY